MTEYGTEKPKPVRTFTAHSVFRAPKQSGFALGLAQAGNPVARFPLAAFLEQFDALETLEHVTFTAQGGSRAETTML
jgi:hypothetical protein